ncbi:MAG: hypothetical protein AAF587_16885 [Bacteroidota bacterium]
MTTNKLLFLSFLALGMSISLFSCREVPGCTDEVALNYSPDANLDDGTCSYERDMFLGTYSGTSVCTQPGFWNSNDFQFTINEDPDDGTKVRLAFPFNMSSKPVIFTATVDGNTLLFDDRTNEPDDLPLCGVENPPMILKGTASLNGNQFSFPDFKFHVEGEDNQAVCPVDCMISAEKDP